MRGGLSTNSVDPLISRLYDHDLWVQNGGRVLPATNLGDGVISFTGNGDGYGDGEAHTDFMQGDNPNTEDVPRSSGIGMGWGRGNGSGASPGRGQGQGSGVALVYENIDEYVVE